jgi:hypothetical protein
MEHSPPPQEEVPDWWRPYTAEFPHWHVWCGVSGLLYARRPLSSPPVVVRATDVEDLRDQIKNREGQMTCREPLGPRASSTRNQVHGRP